MLPPDPPTFSCQLHWHSPPSKMTVILGQALLQTGLDLSQPFACDRVVFSPEMTFDLSPTPSLAEHLRFNLELWLCSLHC